MSWHLVFAAHIFERGRGLWKAWSNYGQFVCFWYFQDFKWAKNRTITHMPTIIEENIFFSPYHLPIMAENSHRLTIFWPFLAYFVRFLALTTTVMCILGWKCTSNLLTCMGRWLEAIQPLSRYHSRSGGIQKYPFVGSKWTMMVGCHISPKIHLETGKCDKTHLSQWENVCWTLLCTIQVQFQVQVGPKMSVFWVKNSHNKRMP